VKRSVVNGVYRRCIFCGSGSFAGRGAGGGQEDIKILYLAPVTDSLLCVRVGL
jgi:hypothetical protein